MLKKTFFLFFILSTLFFLRGEEFIRLHLANGKILSVKKIRLGKEGELFFLHPHLNRFVRLPAHQLVKMQYPKTGEIRDADSLFRQKKYMQSAALFGKTAESLKGIHPWEIYCRFYEAKALFLAGNTSSSLKSLLLLAGKTTRFHAESPKELYRALFLLCKIYEEKKDHEKIYPVLDKLIASPDENFASEALLKKGEIYFTEKKWQEALNCFCLYSILFPNSTDGKKAKEWSKRSLEKINTLRNRKSSSFF